LANKYSSSFPLGEITTPPRPVAVRIIIIHIFVKRRSFSCAEYCSCQLQEPQITVVYYLLVKGMGPLEEGRKEKGAEGKARGKNRKKRKMEEEAKGPITLSNPKNLIRQRCFCFYFYGYCYQI